MSAIAKSYWRSIQRGTRAFASIPGNQQDAVKALAKVDVEAGLIDREAYQEFIGETFDEGTA